MDHSEKRFDELSETQTPLQNRMSVRDRIRQYNTAISSDSTKTSFSSVISPKSSGSGINVNNQEMDSMPSALFIGTGSRLQEKIECPSKSSADSQRNICNTRSPRHEMASEEDYVSLGRQRSFMNLSRSREPPKPAPKAAPREKKPRRSMQMVAASQQMHNDESHSSEASYQSKTTISKTQSGVRIIIDIFFDQNKGLSIEEVVGSRVETDIPPSKILSDFQKRMSENSLE